MTTNAPYGFGTAMLPRDAPAVSPQLDATMISADPEELDAAATVCDGDSLQALKSYLDLSGSADSVEMPVDVRGRVTAAVQDAAKDLFVLSSQLSSCGERLRRTATAFRTAGGDTGALLAKLYAPQLRFTRGEEYLLDDPQWFLDHSTPVSGGYRDLDDRYHKGSLSRAKNLYQWSPETGQLTFWLFYSYNDGTNNHEGDWERVTLNFDGTAEPVRMLFSSHSYSGAVDYSAVEKDPHTQQPLVYVAKGSHANFPHRGDFPTNLLGGHLPLDDDAHGDGIKVDTSRLPAVNVTKQPWYGIPDHWGDDDHYAEDLLPVIGGAAGPLVGGAAALLSKHIEKEFDGPTGPSAAKSHLAEQPAR